MRSVIVFYVQVEILPKIEEHIRKNTYFCGICTLYIIRWTKR